MTFRKLILIAVITAGFASALSGTALAQSTPVKIACIGDSITFGMGVKNRTTKSYPAQLNARLGDQAEVRNFGVSGATLLKKGDKPYWQQKAYKDALSFLPNLVIIKLGTNDSKQRNWKYKADYVTDYIALINSFKALESKPAIWVCYPVPAYAVRFDISDEVIKNEIIPMIDEIAAKTDAKIIDLHSALSGKPELFTDTIHPNANGAELIAETVFSVLKQQKAL